MILNFNSYLAAHRSLPLLLRRAISLERDITESQDTQGDDGEDLHGGCGWPRDTRNTILKLKQSYNFISEEDGRPINFFSAMFSFIAGSTEFLYRLIQIV